MSRLSYCARGWHLPNWRFVLRWNIREWALPLSFYVGSIDYCSNERLWYIQILCVNFTAARPRERR